MDENRAYREIDGEIIYERDESHNISNNIFWYLRGDHQASRHILWNLERLLQNNIVIDIELLKLLKHKAFVKIVIDDDYPSFSSAIGQAINEITNDKPFIYREYLASDEWKEKSKAAKERAGWRCQLCNKSKEESKLHTHHRTYERIGDEHDEDLIVLCAGCHAKFHGKD